MFENNRRTEINDATAHSSGRRTEINAGNNTRKTEVNAGGGNRRTMINTSGSARNTEINPNSRERQTILFSEDEHAISNSSIPTIKEYTVGQTIANYTVVSILNPKQKTGEAVLYLCKNPKGEQVVLKYYNRTDIDIDGKRKLTEILNNIKNVQKTLDLGTDNRHFYEVMPYYKNGSLKDRLKRKLFSEEEIKNDILPRMVQILESLHNASVYHSDIKPENILYADDGKSLVLIDFGVSVITSGSNNTTILTEVGGTADYRAPETQRGILIDASDYYSLGITLFTLMVGSTPTDYLRKQEDVERAQVLSVIPRVNGMSDAMYQLIDGLTYIDIRYRHDRSKPNRWIAQDVKDWLSGRKDIVPPTPIQEKFLIKDLDINIRFRNRSFKHWQDLVLEMSKNWNSGKQFLLNTGMDSLPNAVFQLYSSERSNLERKAALGRLYQTISNYLERKSPNDDATFFSFIYFFSSGEYGWGLNSIFWRGMSFQNAEALGEAIYQSALTNHNECLKQFEGLFSDYNLLVQYFDQLPEKNEKINNYRISIIRLLKNTKGKIRFSTLMDCCFALRKDKSFDITPNRVIKTPEEFKRYVMAQGKTPKGLQQLYQSIMVDDNGMYTILTSWLNYHGVTNFRV